MSNQEAKSNVNKSNRSTNNGNRNRNKGRGKKGGNRKPNNCGPDMREPKKDSAEKRVNYDNTRESKFDNDMAKDHSNDVAWYAKNPEMLKAAGSFGFSYLTGSKLPFAGYGGYGGITQFVPGIMAFNWKPSFGGQEVNVLQKAADQIYNFVVHGNSRNTKYNAADLFVTLVATANVFDLVASMIRAYGTMKNFSDRNDYTPRALVTAMGFDYEDLTANLSTMWFDLNQMVASLGQLWLPKDMPFVARQFWMNTNVYTDAATSKAQYYLYNQVGYLMYQDIQFETGTSLSPLYIMNGSNSVEFQPGLSGNTTYTWAQWRQAFNIAISALINAEDRGTMLGDILKAYGRENLYTVAEIPVDYKIVYTYNAEVLTQFENLTPFTNYNVFLGLRQSATGQLEEYYYGTSNAKESVLYALPPTEQVLNFHQQDTPTPEQIMVATRMKCSGASARKVSCVSQRVFVPNYTTPKPLTVTAYTQAVPYTTGTEVCTEIQVYGLLLSGATGRSQIKNQALNTTMGSESWPGQPTSQDILFCWAAFDWAPWLYNGSGDSSVTTDLVNLSGVDWCFNPTEVAYGDWDNYTIIGNNELRKLNIAAVYSEFGVPMF